MVTRNGDAHQGMYGACQLPSRKCVHTVTSSLVEVQINPGVWMNGGLRYVASLLGVR